MPTAVGSDGTSSRGLTPRGGQTAVLKDSPPNHPPRIGWRDWIGIGNGCIPAWHGRESRGWILASVARGPAALHGSLVFAANMLVLGKELAKATPNGRVFFGLLRPESVAGFLQFFAAALAAIQGPPYGALLDFTRHRKTAWAISGYLLAVTLLMQSSVLANELSWSLAVVLGILVLLSFDSTIAPSYAYLPELSRDKKMITRVSSFGVFFMNCSQVAFAVIVIGGGWAMGLSRLVQIRFSAIVAGCHALVVTWVALQHMKPRQASRQLPPGRSILAIGFIEVGHTVKEMFRVYPVTLTFLVAHSLYMAATISLIVLTTTYMVFVLDMDTMKVQIAFAVALILTLPGAVLVIVVQRTGCCIKVLLIGVVSSLCVSTLLIPALLRGPEDQWLAFFFAAFWGIAVGALFSIARAMYSRLIPEGCEAQFFGIYVFFEKLLAWCPSVIYTSFVEAVGKEATSRSLGVLVLPSFYFVGLVILLAVDVKKARRGHPRGAGPLDLVEVSPLSPRSTSSTPRLRSAKTAAAAGAVGVCESEGIAEVVRCEEGTENTTGTCPEVGETEDSQWSSSDTSDPQDLDTTTDTPRTNQSIERIIDAWIDALVVPKMTAG